MIPMTPTTRGTPPPEIRRASVPEPASVLLLALERIGGVLMGRWITRRRVDDARGRHPERAAMAPFP
jgi:hypothetical protein